MLCHSEMRFTCVGIQTQSRLNRGITQGKTGGRMIESKKIEAIVHAGQFAPAKEKRRIALHRLTEKLSCLGEVAAGQSIKCHRAEPKGSRPGVKIKGSEIRGRPLFDRRFFRGR